MRIVHLAVAAFVQESFAVLHLRLAFLLPPRPYCAGCRADDRQLTALTRCGVRAAKILGMQSSYRKE